MKDKTIGTLKVVASIIAITALILLYTVISKLSFGASVAALLLNAIPSGVVVLVAIPIIYYIFKRNASSEEKVFESKQNLDLVHQPLKLYENYREIAWKPIITKAKSIDIAACYMDSWVNDNWDELIGFFKKGGCLRLVIPDPASESTKKGSNWIYISLDT